jgi:hypothetical protein
VSDSEWLEIPETGIDLRPFARTLGALAQFSRAKGCKPLIYKHKLKLPKRAIGLPYQQWKARYRRSAAEAPQFARNCCELFDQAVKKTH